MAGRPTFVIVGAGLAGGTAAATLREAGFDGRVVLIGDEPDLPYERPPLSKRYLRGEQPRQDLFVRPVEWWDANDVETMLGRRVRHLSAGPIGPSRSRTASEVALRSRAGRDRRAEPPARRAGRRPRRGPPAAADGRRRPDPAAALEADKAVIVGMGFIGAEVAASLRQMGLEVTVVEIFETALYRVLGPMLGRVVEAMHRDHGVEMRFSETVERFEGDGRVERVITQRRPCDRLRPGRRRRSAPNRRRARSPGRSPATASGSARVRRSRPTSRASSPRATWRPTITPSSDRSAWSISTTRSRWGSTPPTRCSAPRRRSTIRTGSGRISSNMRSRWVGWS